MSIDRFDLRKSDELKLKAQYAKAYESLDSFLVDLDPRQRAELEKTPADAFWIQQMDEWQPEDLSQFIEQIDIDQFDVAQVASFWYVMQKKIKNLDLESID